MDPTRPETATSSKIDVRALEADIDASLETTSAEGNVRAILVAQHDEPVLERYTQSSPSDYFAMTWEAATTTRTGSAISGG